MYIRILLSLALAVLATGLAPEAFAQQLLYVHADHLNTPRLVTNGSGTPVWRWDQTEPFGDNLPNEDPDGNSILGHMPLRFPGQYFDKETNLHYNYFRDYDPAIGRYVQSDPIGLWGGLNTYLYVEGNPLTTADPTGRIPAPSGLATGDGTSTGTSTPSGGGAASGSGSSESTQTCFAESCYLKVQIRSPLLTSCTYYCTFSGREFTLFLPGFRICAESVNR